MVYGVNLHAVGANGACLDEIKVTVVNRKDALSPLVGFEDGSDMGVEPGVGLIAR